MYYRQALTGSDFSNSGWVVSLKVRLLGTPGSGSYKFSEVIGQAQNNKSMALGVGRKSIEYILP